MLQDSFGQKRSERPCEHLHLLKLVEAKRVSQAVIGTKGRCARERPLLGSAHATQRLAAIATGDRLKPEGFRADGAAWAQARRLEPALALLANGTGVLEQERFTADGAQ